MLNASSNAAINPVFRRSLRYSFVIPLARVINRRRIGTDRRIVAATGLPCAVAARTVATGIGLTSALLCGNLRLRALLVLRDRLIRLRERSDRGTENNSESNSLDERFHETTSID